jgi:hypothetical protein
VTESFVGPTETRCEGQLLRGAPDRRRHDDHSRWPALGKDDRKAARCLREKGSGCFKMAIDEATGKVIEGDADFAVGTWANGKRYEGPWKRASWQGILSQEGGTR